MSLTRGSLISAAGVCAAGLTIWFAACALGWAIDMRPAALALQVTAGAAIGYGFAKLLDNSVAICIALFVGLNLFGAWVFGSLDGRAYYAGVLLVGGAVIASLVAVRFGDSRE